MEPESSLPYSQAPATCPYPEPTPSSPHNPLIYLNMILPSTSLSPQWSLSLRLPHQNLVHTSPFSHTRYMSRPSHSSRFYQPYNIWWAVQIIKLLIMQFSPLSCYPVPLRPTQLQVLNKCINYTLLKDYTNFYTYFHCFRVWSVWNSRWRMPSAFCWKFMILVKIGSPKITIYFKVIKSFMFLLTIFIFKFQWNLLQKIRT